ncbi:unnamed protein product [Penicillium salamii]|nr:unnamed protein product [Penicillium salamii]CAG7947317.1 unnamed protein product [Penicillium salamii]CAG7947578.1 unnamed protein product [Penicillium salamii]CAG8238730.1 unnamed protein product [Penicillium salamii]CAG8345529.1 unnamed protein product [Penicillium salamii]
MKFSLVALAAITPMVSAHYFFDTIVIDGKEASDPVRSNTRPAKYNPTKWVNTRDDMTPDMPDFRCNKGAFTFAGQTGTAEVKAGSNVAMKLAVGAKMQHPGPAIVYMSKAPTTAKEYEGDGEWFKVHQEGVCDKNKDFTKDAWCTYGKDRIEFTIPASLSDGEYLVRPEHIGVHGAAGGQAEFYFTCAQVKVVGGGNGSPGPTVKFPGAYKKDDPSFNFSIWNGYKEYPMPGPEVWTGELDSSANSKVASGNGGADAATTSNKPGENTPDAFTRCARSCFQYL